MVVNGNKSDNQFYFPKNMKKTINKLIILFFLSLFAQIGFSQSVTILPNKETVKGRTQIDGRLFINSNSDFPIPTNSYLKYGSILSVSEAADSSDIDLVLFEESSSSPLLNFAKARGTKALPTTVKNTDDLFQIRGLAYHQDDFYDVAGIHFFVDGTPTATSLPTGMQISTTREGYTEAVTAISVRGTGNVGIGTISPQEQLSVMRGMNIDHNNNNDGTVDNGLKFGRNSGEGIASRRTDANSSNYNGLDFYTNFNSRMTITNNGIVGIGTTSPTQAKLVVNGYQNTDNTPSSYGYLNNAGSGVSTGTNAQNYSIYASNRIAASEFNAFSDVRIKDIIGLSNNEQDLETLSKIKITDYTFKDKIGRGNGQNKKVIAQQVESIYPQAVSKITDCIPDIYRLAKIENGFIELPNHTLKIGEKVKLIFDDKQELVEVKEANERGFQIVNPKSKIVNQQVFVYGREVSDFRSVDYEALSMLNVSATQALLKRLNEVEKKVFDLENQQRKTKAFEARLSALENPKIQLSSTKK